jgi:uncharacterized membrane protein YkgB
MVLIFISLNIQKFTPESANGIAKYVSNSPLVSELKAMLNTDLLTPNERGSGCTAIGQA